MEFDIIVVGGGPAGSLCAFHLAKSGLRTCLIDKAVFPRVKPCAGGLTRKAQEAIPFDISPVVECSARGGYLTYKGKLLIQTDFPKPIASLVNRAQFDHYLVNKAIDEGVNFIEKTRLISIQQNQNFVTAILENQRISAKFLVGADGVNSVCAKNLKLLNNRQLGYAIEAEITVDEAFLSSRKQYVTFDFGLLKNGYGWIFPKSDHLSIGVCSIKEIQGTNLRSVLSNFIKQQTNLANLQMNSLRGYPVPLGGSLSPLHQGRCLLVGDAANLADSWLGEGIYYAIQSAKIGAECIIRQFQESSPNLIEYSKHIHRDICLQLQYARKMANLVYGHEKLANFLIHKNRRLLSLVMDIISGDLTHMQLYQTIKRDSIGILLKAIFSIKNNIDVY